MEIHECPLCGTPVAIGVKTWVTFYNASLSGVYETNTLTSALCVFLIRFFVDLKMALISIVRRYARAIVLKSWPKCKTLLNVNLGINNIYAPSHGGYSELSFKCLFHLCLFLFKKINTTLHFWTSLFPDYDGVGLEAGMGTSRCEPKSSFSTSTILLGRSYLVGLSLFLLQWWLW